MRPLQTKVLTKEALQKVCSDLKKQGKRIVSTNGCFDILHLGHLQYLEKARALGDILICAVNSDESVRKLKGPSRPIHSENTRALQLAALESIDYVVVFGEDNPEKILALIQPHVHVKGGDYRAEDLPEKKIVEQFGGEVKCVALTPGFSTTQLIENLKN